MSPRKRTFKSHNSGKFVLLEYMMREFIRKLTNSSLAWPLKPESDVEFVSTASGDFRLYLALKNLEQGHNLNVEFGNKRLLASIKRLSQCSYQILTLPRFKRLRVSSGQKVVLPSGTSFYVPWPEQSIVSKLLHSTSATNLVDRKLLELEIGKLPTFILANLYSQQVKVVAVRGSVCNYLHSLKGKSPRGWPEGSTFNSVNGVYMKPTREAVIGCVSAGRLEHKGSCNVVLHELLHAYDHNCGRPSSSKSFLKARQQDLKQLSNYETQSGQAGAEETFAETGAMYYEGHPLIDSRPTLRNWFDSRLGGKTNTKVCLI